MKFECSIEIDLPIEQVTVLWSNPDNLKYWQDGFVSIELLSGTAGQPGAKSKMIYMAGKNQLELIETIKVNQLPDEFSGHYEAKQMVNTMTNRFAALDDRRTKWTTEVEYTKFNGLMPKLMATLMPGVFRKQVQKWLDQFKVFAEKSGQSA